MVENVALRLMQMPKFDPIGAFQKGASVGEELQQMSEMQRARELAKQYEETGDTGLISKMAAYDPARAKAITGVISGAEQEKIKYAGALAGSVLQAPPEQRQAVYEQALKAAQEMGVSTAGLPQVYDANAEARLKVLAGMTGSLPKPEAKMTEYQRAMIGLKEREIGIKQQRDIASADFMRKALMPGSEAKPTGDTMGQLEQVDNAYNAALLTGQPDSTVKRLEGMRNSLQKKQDKLDKQAQKYSDKIEKGGIAELVQSVKAIDNMIAGEKDIPGVGQTGFLPNWAMSEKGKAIRQEVQGLANVILKARSGGAITPSEQGRYYKELGLTADGTLTAGFTDKDFRRGIAKVSRDLSAKIKNLAAGVNPEALKIYQERGGTTVPGVFKEKEKTTSSMEGRTATNPKTGEKMIFKGGQWQKL